MCESSTSGYSCDNAITLFLHNMDASSTLALSTEQSFPRRCRAILNATRAMRSISCAVLISVLKPNSSPFSLVPKPLGFPK
uniref:Uncharacterized protein n=1 Tax=Lotus japonicus TaxID=34305 RepID=I3SZ33_LOTJA|nr:unknown [Lotus japonicus]